MNINYIETEGKKLFSFHRYDFQMLNSGEFIDGGFDYTRFNGNLKSDTIENLIADIREQFQWGQNYDERHNRLPKTKYQLLKDLTSSHILGILTYFTERIKPPEVVNDTWKAYHLIFLYELKYRDEEARKTTNVQHTC